LTQILESRNSHKTGLSANKVIIGVDIGTTNTRVAIAQRRSKTTFYEVVENRFGLRNTPSMVVLDESGDEMVGSCAKMNQSKFPNRTIYGTKRLLGLRRGDIDVKKIFKIPPLAIDYTTDNYPIIKIPATENDRARTFKPEEVTARILGEVIKIVKNKTGKKPDDCIITVPAYFNYHQRQLTKDAAKMAGLNCSRIVNEPTAAVVAYKDMNKINNGNVMVFDFSGGNLDVSILEVKGNTFEIKTVCGDVSLGGEDIDAIIVEEMVKRFMRKNPGNDPRENMSAMIKLKQKCEEAKHQLFRAPESHIVIYPFYESIGLNERITSSKLEFLCDEIITKVSDIVTMALEEVKLKPEDINHVILIGESCRLPFITKTISDIFKKIEPLTNIASNEAIAIGAAIICDKSLKGDVFIDNTKNITRKTIDNEKREDIRERVVIDERKDLSFKYKKLLKDLHIKITRCNAKEMDKKAWEIAFNSFFKNIPENKERLKKGINDMKELINRI
jgi:molecular chaperone DnaK (HSP70)